MKYKSDFLKDNKFINVEYNIEEDTNCPYIFTVIQKEFSNNKCILPKLCFTNKDFKKSTSLYDYMINKKAIYGINAGIFNTTTCTSECLLIKNKKILIDAKETYIHTNFNDGGEKESYYIF